MGGGGRLLMFKNIRIGPCRVFFRQLDIERIRIRIMPFEIWLIQNPFDNARAFLPPADDMRQQIMKTFNALIF